MEPTKKPCPPELLGFCRRELEAVRTRIDESLEHLAEGQHLAALGALDGTEKQLAFASNALQLTTRLYSNRT